MLPFALVWWVHTCHNYKGILTTNVAILSNFYSKLVVKELVVYLAKAHYQILVEELLQPNF